MSARSPRPLRLAPRHKVRVLCEGLFLMGPNYFRFLRAVDETGTIREAGEEAFRLAHHLVILVDGVVRAAGSTGAVYRDPSIATRAMPSWRRCLPTPC
jgi:hypothetical protein